MNDKQEELKFLSEVERRLASDRPFGDYRYIDGQTWLHYESRLKMLAKYVPAAGQTLKAFAQASGPSRYRVMGDPVVRSAINTGLSYFKLSGPEVNLEEIAGVLQVATRQLRANSRISPLSLGVAEPKRLGRSLHHGWIWKDEREENLPAKSFRGLFSEHVDNGRKLALWTPDEPAHQMLLLGTQLLGELLPKLSRSALSHAHVVVIGKAPFPITSVTNPSIPGTAFFAPFVLKHPWRAAEYLLHEALHLKFIDLEQTHSMLRRGYSIYRSPKIEALWNRGQKNSSNKWPVNRVLTVAHTYACLALFFKMVELRAAELVRVYGPLQDLDPVLSARRALDRAHYLALKLRSVSRELGLAGRLFGEWVLEIVERMDSHPRPTGLDAHLLLDLYERETDQLRLLLSHHRHQLPGKGHNSGSQLGRRLLTRDVIAAMIQGELSTTGQLFSRLGMSSPILERGQQDILRLASRSSDAMAARVLEVRSQISGTLGELMVTDQSRVLLINKHIRVLLKGSAGHIRVLSERLGA